MKKVFKWIKEHVRPYYRYNTDKCKSKKETQDTNVGDLKENSEIGVKIKFKF